MENIKDFLGNTLQVFDKIVYPTRGGSWMHMNVGVILGIEKDEKVKHKEAYKLIVTKQVEKWVKSDTLEGGYGWVNILKKVTIRRIERVVKVN